MKIVLFTAVLAFATLIQANTVWRNVFSKHLDVAKFHRNEKPNTRITGGKEAEPHSRPWQVALFIPTNEGTAFCGGSLITTSTVLTAARCVAGFTGPVQVTLGAHKVLEEEDTQVKVNSSNVISHPDFDSGNFENDIALIVLEEPVELNENIQTIDIAEDNGNLYTDKLASVSGWGKQFDDATGISPVLREAPLTIIDNGLCDFLYIYTGFVRDSSICGLGSIAQSPCEGDSGGPLVIERVQVGIASFYEIACGLGWPPVFTRVSSFVDFINENKV